MFSNTAILWVIKYLSISITYTNYSKCTLTTWNQDQKEMKKFLSSLPLLLLKRQHLLSPLLPFPLSFLSLSLYLSLFLSSLQILLTLIPYPVPIYKLYIIPPPKVVILEYLEINCIFLCNPWTKYKERNYNTLNRVEMNTQSIRICTEDDTGREKNLSRSVI